MKQVVGSLAVLLALAALTGCSGMQRVPQSANDIFTNASMNVELSHAIASSDPIDVMGEELSHTIGTTMLTNASFVVPAALAQSVTTSPLDLTIDPVLRTWGASAPAEPSEQSSRE